MKYRYWGLVVLTTLLFIPQSVSAYPSSGIAFAPFISIGFIFTIFGIPFFVFRFFGKKIDKSKNINEGLFLSIALIITSVSLNLGVIFYVWEVIYLFFIVSIILGFLVGNKKWNLGKSARIGVIFVISTILLYFISLISALTISRISGISETVPTIIIIVITFIGLPSLGALFLYKIKWFTKTSITSSG